MKQLERTFTEADEDLLLSLEDRRDELGIWEIERGLLPNLDAFFITREGAEEPDLVVVLDPEGVYSLRSQFGRLLRKGRSLRAVLPAAWLPELPN